MKLSNINEIAIADLLTSTSSVHEGFKRIVYRRVDEHAGTMDAHGPMMAHP